MCSGGDKSSRSASIRTAHEATVERSLWVANESLSVEVTGTLQLLIVLETVK